MLRVAATAAARSERPIPVRRLVGLPLEQARVAAERHGCYLRIVKLDGRPHELFLDARRLRINVIVERGVVTGIRDVT